MTDTTLWQRPCNCILISKRLDLVLLLARVVFLLLLSWSQSDCPSKASSRRGVGCKSHSSHSLSNKVYAFYMWMHCKYQDPHTVSERDSINRYHCEEFLVYLCTETPSCCTSRRTTSKSSITSSGIRHPKRNEACLWSTLASTYVFMC